MQPRVVAAPSAVAATGIMPRALTLAGKGGATPTATTTKSASQTAALLAQVQARIAEQKAQQQSANMLLQQAQGAQSTAPVATISTSQPFFLPSRSTDKQHATPLLAAGSAAAASDEDETAVAASGGGVGGLSAALRPGEYDPRHPNEYEQYVQVRDARRREEKEAQQARRERERERRRREDEDYDDDEQMHQQSSLPLPIAIIHSSASPPAPAAASSSSSSVLPAASSTGGGGAKLDLRVSSGEEAFARRAALSRGGPPAMAAPAPPPQPPSSSYDANKRARTDTGVAIPTAGNGTTAAAAATPVPSRVVLLLNMVGRGEVDDELEQETADECAKFGRVLKCTVFEVPLPVATAATTAASSDAEAVRIFVKFEQLSAAVQAQRELDGRPFAGRKVRATFVDESKFNRGQLAP
jgi:splicing factor 45